MTDTPDTQLYRQHLETLDRYLTSALERAAKAGHALEGVLFHAGRVRTYYADDEAISFRATPHFRRWVPLPGADHVVLARPGAKPRVVQVQPQDFWLDTTPPPASYWEAAVDLEVVDSFDAVGDALGSLDGVAYVGEAPEAAAELGIPEDLVEPAALMAPLDWYRAYKTEYEVSRVVVAAERSASGHQAARELFEAGGTEREIHWAYLEGADALEKELPFETIVALDEKAATLHYQFKRGPEAAPGKVLLVDAGAGFEGWASDITRTWAGPGADPVYVQLLEGLDAIERDLVALVTPGRPYLEIHVETHRRVAALLAEAGVFKIAADEAFDAGLTRAFLPHGVGHHLGIQVHDVGGHQAGPEGGKVPPPEEYAFLRNTRILEPGHLVTIEPGIYFIPMLLEPLRQGEHAAALDWALVDRLTGHGGIRIEDDVLCTEGEPRDLTRDRIAGPRGG